MAVLPAAAGAAAPGGSPASPAAARPGGSPPSSAAVRPGGSPAYGGTQIALRPIITGVQCLSGCAASSASSRTRAVSVRDAGTVKVRGRNMSGVRTVIFTGAAGPRDDVRVSPRAVGRLSVDVVVPARAASGRIVLYSGASYSSPSSAALVVVHHHGDNSGGGDSHKGAGNDNNGSGNGNGAPSGQGLIWPVPRATIFGVFGENRGDHFHSGIDIAAPLGTPVHAAAAGRVLFVGPEGGYGNFICVAHRTISTCYAHLSEFKVTVGQSVDQGQVIGLSGCTGNCSGPHLHFEVRTGTQMWATPVNPMLYLPGGTTTARSSAVTAPRDYDLPVYGLR